MVGVNPEVAHEQMAGLNFYHVVAQAIEAGKLFHIDLNDQKPGRFDQDLRFGSESIKALFFLVKLLEESGYDGPRHFDAHAYRTECQTACWDFARGCMRSYLILKEKARAVPRDQPRSRACSPRFRRLGGQAARRAGTHPRRPGAAGAAVRSQGPRDAAAALRTPRTNFVRPRSLLLGV